MYSHFSKQEARHEDGLHVIVIGRVSTSHQDVGNIEAGYAYAEQALEGITDGSLVIRRFGEQGSGMLVERDSILRVQQLVEEGWADLVIMEDLSKAFRNPRWMVAFVQDCVDAGVRVIAPGDNFDTRGDNWELMLNASSLRHGLHIPDTRRRVRRTATSSFEKGGMVLRARYGYRRLTREQAKATRDHPDDLLIARVDEQTHVFRDLWRLIVKERMYGQPVVDWLNDRGIPPGPYARDGRWTWDMVRDLLRDPILYGWRRFRQMIYQPIYKTGKHRRERNANPEWQYFGCLAHMSKDEWEMLQRAMDELTPTKRNRTGRDHPRYRVRRTDSVVPYQHATCAACGAFYYPSNTDSMKCKNAWTNAAAYCWNHVQIKPTLAREAVVDLVLERMNRHPLARQALLEAAWERIQQELTRTDQVVADLDREIKELEKQSANLAKAIRSGVALDSVMTEATAADAALKQAKQKRKRAVKKSASTNLPQSVEELTVEPRTVLLELAGTSFEFADLLRCIIPSMIVQPVQQLDSGQVRPRLILTLDLNALLDAKDRPLKDAGGDADCFTIDLFTPPAHIRELPRILEVKRNNSKWGYVRIARQLNVGRMTVKRALRYSELVRREGLAEPYRVLATPPDNASRWRSAEERRTRRHSA